MNVQLMRQALDRIGAVLAAQEGFPSVTLVLAGGAAGMLGELLPTSRVTIDCDVIWSDAQDVWMRIEEATRNVAQELELSPEWLNRKCAIFGFNLALGWLDRCEDVGTFGPLHLRRISRFDLIALKLVSAPKRPQDLKDIISMSPTAEELELLEAHIDRVESEDLDRASFERHRGIIERLRGMT